MKLAKIVLTGFGALILVLGLMPCVSASEIQGIPTNVVVNGTMVETDINAHFSEPYGVKFTLKSTISGDLSGTGINNIYSSELDGVNVVNVLGNRIWHLTEGQLFTSEVGQNLAGDATIQAKVTGGTGIYKGATGTLLLIGTHVPPNRVELTYTGILVLLK